MGLEDKVDKLAEDFAEHRGEMREFTKNAMGYVGAVDRQLKSHLDDHQKKAEGEVTDSKKASREWIAIGISLLIGVGTIAAEAYLHAAK